jgi:hypothetical protein
MQITKRTIIPLLFFGMLSVWIDYHIYAQSYGAEIAPKLTCDKSWLTSDGKLTEESVPKFLAKAYDEKKFTDDSFSKEACLKAKNIGAQGGLQTLQLFMVTSTCHHKEASMYIIKESYDGLSEASHLKAIEAFPGMKELVAPNKVAGLPSLALPFAYFSYSNSKMHYIAAMPAAKGKVLTTILSEFRDNQSPQNKERLARAFRILGRETGAFHKRFMKPDPKIKVNKTVIHGDFHPFNLFFDEIGGHFTFIDNETMVHSLNEPRSPAVDIVELYIVPFTVNPEFQHFRDLIKGVDIKEWWNITLKNFLLGYLESYKPDERKQVLQEIKKMFANFSYGWAQFNDVQLKKLKEDVINPIFDALIKES